MYWKIGIVYLAVLNIIGYFSMWLDKRKAQKRKWRIPEKTLFFIAMIGGSIGSIAGMYHFRHKTKHKSFVIGMPMILFVQIGIILFFLIDLFVKQL